MTATNGIHAVLFDLDGTLVDTAPDLARALNQTLARYGREPLPFEDIRPVVSHGGMALIRLGFGLEPEEPGFDERRAALLDIYRREISVDSRLFPGMAEVLDTLEASGIAWGIVTNKPAWLTEPLLADLGLLERAGCTVCGDTCPERKPHPMPILHACELLAVEPANAVYVGDAGRDMAASRAAGTAGVGALFGYLMPGDDPRDWQADHLIDAPVDLLALLDGSAAPSSVPHAGPADEC